MTCPSELELSRAITGSGGLEADPAGDRGGDRGDCEGDRQIRAHLADCTACRATRDRTRALIDLARELPAELPSQARCEEVRTAVLAAAASVTRRPARRAWLAPVITGAAAAVAVGYLAIPRGPSPPPVMALTAPVHHSHGVVRPHPGARYLASPSGPDEIVRLTDGILDVEVEPLAPGERFRVVVGGAEIEVRGTEFTVTASAEHLTGVAVARGRVDVRPETGAPAVVVAGQSWHVALVTAAEPPPPSIPPPPSPRSRTTSVPHRAAMPPPLPLRAAAAMVPRTVTPAPPRVAEPRVAAEPSSPAAAKPEGAAARDPQELAYDQAWEALRANNFTRAASGFARVLLLAPDSALVEDAGFWRAVALARGKRSAEALSAFRDFLDAYARSARAGEASAMLGWLLIDAGAYDEAERRFRAAAGDGNTAVRSSATAGLEALARRKR
jgi:hypothetical protein